tara:strand:- start:1325 stop:2338 length:1014 start_codon:yes stop_codon:yes gene_type:complete
MKRKNLSVPKLKNIIYKNTKISKIYLKLSSITKNTKSLTVAVSGGSDSMALVLLSKFLEQEKSKKIYYVHVDHGIRSNSNKQALHLKNILKKAKINLKIIKNMKNIKKNIQKNARDTRYKILSDFCKKNNTKTLLTAHHKDDQIETFLIRLSRGSGVEGLSSMSEITKLNNGIKLLRPFLMFKKEDLEVISKKFFKTIIKDPSNKNKKFLRTNIRELTTILKNKGIDPDQIYRSIENISSTKKAINFYVEQSLKKFVKFKKKETILNFLMFQKQPNDVKFKIINTIVKSRSESYYPPRAKKVINLINRFKSKSSIKSTLGGCIFEKRKNFVHVTKEF